MVAVDLATGDAPEWVTSRQYLHDLARVGGRGFDLAKAPVVVQHRYRQRRRKRAGRTVVVTVTDPDAEAKNSSNRLIEGAGLGLAVWCADEAGPYPAIPQPGASWRPVGEPIRYPHEYVRGGTAKLLTLFHPVTGRYG